MKLFLYDWRGNSVKRHQVLCDGTRSSSNGAWPAICGEFVGICNSVLFAVKLGIDLRENDDGAHLGASMLKRNII
jgi:hypothetical protein